MERIPCAICGSARARNLPEFTRLTNVRAPAAFVQCSRCGLIYMNPRPSPSEVAQEYTEDYYRGYIAGGGMAGGDAELAGPLRRRLDRLDMLFPNHGRLLEIGCAMGHFLNEARLRGWDVEGAEISAWAADYARRHYGLKVQAGSVDEISIPDDQYDVIHLHHVFEHLPNPAQTLRRLFGWLRSGGLLVIEVPNELGDLLTRVRWWLGKSPDIYAMPSSHLYIYRPTTLSRMVQLAGFNKEQVATYRTNANLQSRIPFGLLAKRAIYRLESVVGAGPLIELLARKP